MSARLGRVVVAFAAAVTTAVGMVAVNPVSAAADTGDIVINEMMTKAGPSTDPAFEFIELYNRGVDPVDISGWAFSAGIALDPALYPLNAAGTLRVFPAGTVVPGHAYFVGSSNTAVFSAVTSLTAEFSFAPSGLSSSGETVTLVDGAGSTVDTVSYGAAAPWPSSPNGTGPSLELVDPFLDNSVATNWGASTGDNGTPKARNSIYGAPPPTLSGVLAQPARPSAGQSFTVQATMPPGASATLTYKVMFGSNVTIPFLDNAASVGGSNDGTYSAVVPGAPAGNLVRYRIDATIGTSPVSWPAAGDSRGFDGVVVADPALSTAQLPVMEWFLGDADYAALLRTVCDEIEYVGVITWQGKVYDNSTFRRRGQSSCNDPEPKIDMVLPDGYSIDFGPYASANAAPFTGPLDEWALQNEAYPIPGLGWDNVRRAGDPPLGYMPVRTQRNGAFFGVGAVLEKYDGTWRSRLGYADGSMYKVDSGGLRTFTSAAALGASLDLDKKDPDDGDFTDAWQLTQVLNQAPSAAKTAWIYANVDVPAGGQLHGGHRGAAALGLWWQELLHLPRRQCHRALEDPALGPGRHLLGRLRHQGRLRHSGHVVQPSLPVDVRDPGHQGDVLPAPAHAPRPVPRRERLPRPVRRADRGQGRRPRPRPQQVGWIHPVEQADQAHRRRAGEARPDRGPHQRQRGAHLADGEPERGDQRDPVQAGIRNGRRGVPRALQPLDQRGGRRLGLADQGGWIRRRAVADPSGHGHPQGWLRVVREP